MNLKTFLIVAPLFGVLGLTGCTSTYSWKPVEGDGHVITQAREVSQFNRVGLSGSGELTVTQGDEESLTIEADENLLPLIKSEVSHGRLAIGPKNVNLRPTRTIRYRLKLKNLEALEISGSAHAETGPIKTESLALRVSGSGKSQVAQLEAKRLSAHISGSGATAVTGGEVGRQDVAISGSGAHHAADLQCEQAEVQVSGSGRATLWAKEALGVFISGSGDVDYYGNPQVNKHVSGSGRIHRLGSK